MKYYTEYEGVWYRYKAKKILTQEMWSLSDRQDGMGNVSNYNAGKYRIDQCIKMFKKELRNG